MNDSQDNSSQPSGRAVSGSTSRRVAINVIFSLMEMVVMLVVNMYLMSFVFRAIGIDRFSAYRLAVTISMGARYLSFGMASSVLRLASDSIAADDWDGLSRRMSVARIYLLGAALVAVVVVVIGSFVFLGALNISLDIQPGARVLFQLTAVAAAVHLLSTLYIGLLQAMQRFELAAAVVIGQLLLRVVLVIVLFKSGWSSLEALGVCLAVSSVAGVAAGAVCVHKVLPRLKMSFRRMGRKAARGVMGFGFWTAVNEGAMQALDMGSMPVVSATLGLAATGVYAVPKMICMFMTRPGLRMIRAMRPAATTYVVRGQREPLIRLYKGGTRLAMASCALVVALFSVFGLPFLTFWMGPEMRSAYIPLLVLLGLTYLRGVGGVAEQWILGVGRIAGVGVTRVIACVLGLACGIAIGIWTEWGLAAMIAGFFVPTALRGLFYLPWVVRRDVGIPLRTSILECSVLPLLAATIPAAVGLGLCEIWKANSFFVVLVQMFIASCAFVPVVWFILLSKEERGVILNVIRRKRTIIKQTSDVSQ